MSRDKDMLICLDNLPGSSRIVLILMHELSWSVFRHFFILQNAICALYPFMCYILNSESLSDSTWVKPPLTASWKLFQESEIRKLQDLLICLPSLKVHWSLLFDIWYQRENSFSDILGGVEVISSGWGGKGNFPVPFTPSWLEVKDLTHLYLKLAFTL